jgi:hypothetical protein
MSENAERPNENRPHIFAREFIAAGDSTIP